jgi:hypothetical protein
MAHCPSTRRRRRSCQSVQPRAVRPTSSAQPPNPLSESNFVNARRADVSENAFYCNRHVNRCRGCCGGGRQGRVDDESESESQKKEGRQISAGLIPQAAI